MTSSITLLRVVAEIGYCEGGERSVHRDGLMDKDTTGGVEEREEEERDIAA